MTIEYPNYNESLVSLASSILRFYNAGDCGHGSLDCIDSILSARNPMNVVLMLFDGFGYNIMNRNLPDSSFLRRHMVRSISSTFPPTTVAATTALRSGMTPLENGWLGWFSYYSEMDEIVTTFTSHRQSDDTYVGRDLAGKYIPYVSVGSKVSKSNPDVTFTELTPFSKAGIDSLSKMESSLANLLTDGTRNFVYCYWPDPDRTMHGFGVNDPRSIEVERSIDSFVEHLSSRFNDTIFIIVADHGLVDAKYLYLADHPKLLSMLKRPFSIESRAATFFVKPESLHEFGLEFERCFGDHFMLLRKDDFFSSGLLGVGMQHPMVDEFVGDFIAISKDSYCLAMKKESDELIGIHAGLTQDEMLVPLIVVDRT